MARAALVLVCAFGCISSLAHAECASEQRILDGTEKSLRAAEARAKSAAAAARAQAVHDVEMMRLSVRIERDALDRCLDRAESDRLMAEEAAKEQARIEAVHRDPEAMAGIFGAELCYLAELRKEALEAMAAETKRPGKHKQRAATLRELRTSLRRIDRAEQETRQSLSDHPGVSPAACSAPGVRELLWCAESLDSDDCPDDDDLRYLAGFVRLFPRDGD